MNPRAAAIADVVLWIGFLQQHYRSQTGHPSEPILRAHGNIRCTDAALDWDGAPDVVTGYRDGAAVQLWPNPRPAMWPEAEFIVGNPPSSAARICVRAWTQAMPTHCGRRTRA